MQTSVNPHLRKLGLRFIIVCSFSLDRQTVCSGDARPVRVCLAASTHRPFCSVLLSRRFACSEPWLLRRGWKHGHRGSSDPWGAHGVCIPPLIQARGIGKTSRGRLVQPAGGWSASARRQSFKKTADAAHADGRDLRSFLWRHGESLFRGEEVCSYHGKNISLGAQTIHPGDAGPVRVCLAASTHQPLHLGLQIKSLRR